jgi:hypothetical protein
MKGYFGIGIEGASKAVNVGTLFRTAHAFGAFQFTVRAQYSPRRAGQRHLRHAAFAPPIISPIEAFPAAGLPLVISNHR